MLDLVRAFKEVFSLSPSPLNLNLFLFDENNIFLKLEMWGGEVSRR